MSDERILNCPFCGAAPIRHPEYGVAGRPGEHLVACPTRASARFFCPMGLDGGEDEYPHWVADWVWNRRALPAPAASEGHDSTEEELRELLGHHARHSECCAVEYCTCLEWGDGPFGGRGQHSTWEEHVASILAPRLLAEIERLRASEGLLSEEGADALAVTCGLRIIEGGYKGRRVAWMNFALELHRILVRAALRSTETPQ